MTLITFRYPGAIEALEVHPPQRGTKLTIVVLPNGDVHHEYELLDEFDLENLDDMGNEID